MLLNVIEYYWMLLNVTVSWSGSGTQAPRSILKQ